MKCIFLIISIVFLHAGTNDELFNKAQILENDGKYAEAMKIYKILARQNFDLDTKTTQSQVKPSKKVEKALQESTQTSRSDEILGIRLYDLNYLLPASVATKHIDGRRSFETKFQLSLQKPIAHNLFGLDESIVAAYSQTSWWQTASSSTPFRETNYRPEIFVSIPTNFAFPHIKALNFGLLHESNGRGGEYSRSWNRFYAKGEFVFGKIAITPRIWARIPDAKDDNPNITSYIGRADITAFVPIGEHFLRAMLRNNLHFDKTNKGASELSWLFPFGKSGIYGYLQYFTGYGESLIDYNRNINKISIGFSILK
ncbi:MAG: phospholipase A [Campylobacter sp.]